MSFNRLVSGTLLILFLIVFPLKNVTAQIQDGLLYNFTFFVDKQLIDEYYKEAAGNKYLKDFISTDAFSDDLKQHILSFTEESFSKYFDADVSALMLEAVLTPGQGYLEGYPSVGYKKARKEGEYDRYIKFAVRFDLENVETSDIGYKKIKITPKILVSVTIYDKNKKIVNRNNLIFREFSDFASKNKKSETNKREKAKPITVEDIFILYKYALKQLLATTPVK